MDENVLILQALRKDSEGSNKAYEALLAQGAVGAGFAGKAQYLADLNTPITYAAPPANAPQGTQPTPQLSPNQLLMVEAYKNTYQSNQSSGTWMKTGVVTGLAAAALLAWHSAFAPIKGTEEHITKRETFVETHYERQNDKYKRFNHGEDAPWYKNKPTREELDQQAADGREAVKSAGRGLTTLFGYGTLALLAYALMKRKS